MQDTIDRYRFRLADIDIYSDQMAPRMADLLVQIADMLQLAERTLGTARQACDHAATLRVFLADQGVDDLEHVPDPVALLGAKLTDPRAVALWRAVVDGRTAALLEAVDRVG